MSTKHICHIALLGLPPVDRALIESLLRQVLTGRADCEWVRDLEQADLIVASADDPNTVLALQSRRLAAPVLLLGDSDAGTGWPLLSRPIQAQAVLEAVNRLTPLPGRAPAARLAAGAPAPSTGAAPAQRAQPAFEATVPFAPLEMGGASGPSGAPAGPGFDLTQPFARSVSDDAAVRAMPVRSPVPPASDDPIDAHSVLLWRDAQAAPPSARAARPVQTPGAPPSAPAPDAGFPALAGFESTRDEEDAEAVLLPGNWRELARQQAQARQLQAPAPAPEPENLSSSFADRGDQPTLPPAFATPGKRIGILLIGEERLADSSLIRALRGFGYPVDYVPDAEVALSRLASQEYGFAFLDEPSLGRQTLPVGKALRKRAHALGQRVNVVVIARQGGLLRRLLARFAGCDAWMTLPLNRKSLRQYLVSKA